MNFATYDTGGFYDEMFLSDGSPRPGVQLLAQKLAALPEGELLQRQRAAERAFLHRGITFSVYDESGAGTERIFPFDIVPRIVVHKGSVHKGSPIRRLLSISNTGPVTLSLCHSVCPTGA